MTVEPGAATPADTPLTTGTATGGCTTAVPVAVPPGAVTLTTPDAPAGMVTTNRDFDADVTVAATPPMLTELPANDGDNPDPSTVTGEPWAARLGETPSTRTVTAGPLTTDTRFPAGSYEHRLTCPPARPDRQPPPAAHCRHAQNVNGLDGLCPTAIPTHNAKNTTPTTTRRISATTAPNTQKNEEHPRNPTRRGTRR